MADTVRRATWHTITSFLLCAAFIGVGYYSLRQGVTIAGRASDDAAFGSGPVDEAVTLYITQGNIYEPQFKEPFETAVIVTWSGEVFTFSTHESSRVGCAVTQIVSHLETCGFTVPDIAAIVHNHFTPSGFTDADRATWMYLKNRGLCGVFGIWYTATKKFVAIEEMK